ncbi:MAG: hypothetical protein CVT59_10710 [Actinobacteria bacterium HGW-Actinobacteria-1]|jgi:hypothetical protein|nr:MAG: hypothetical protein CVT59_10710 [Actinobacteria bacterium HGW-Actinobacteria-1]
MSEWTAPQPLPVEAPRRKRGIVIAVVVLVVLALCGCACVATAISLSLAAKSTSTDSAETKNTGVWNGDPAAFWCGDGRYAVVQTTELGLRGFRPQQKPVVVVIDKTTRATRVMRDMRVVSVEVSSPVVWLVPDAAGPLPDTWDAGARAVLGANQAWDSWDDPEGDLITWDLSTDTTTSIDPLKGGAWQPWTGPAGVSVVGEIDPQTGAAPWILEFTVPGQAQPVEWYAPDASTFEPLGWSPSGRYFAVVTLLPAYAAADEPQLLSRDEAILEGEQKLLIIDTEDGSISASMSVGLARPNRLRSHVAWDDDEDFAYCAVSWANGAEADSGYDYDLMCLPADGSEAYSAYDTSTLNVQERPGRLPDIFDRFPWITGSFGGPASFVQRLDSGVHVWTAGGDGAMTELVTLPANVLPAIAVAPDGTTVALAPPPTAPAAPGRAVMGQVLFASPSENAKVVWESVFDVQTLLHDLLNSTSKESR